MTRKVFWENPYQTTLETNVTSVSGNDILLAETIFYAESGGQESDAGTIAGFSVLKAAKQGREIVYTLEEDHGLMEGDRVQISINWPRRYRLMRLHFAAELVLELIYKRLENIDKTGAHIAEHKARIDFAWKENLAETVAAVRTEAQQIIEADQPVISAFSDEEAERRYWKIEGFSQVPCGGTHLRRTGEIGKLTLKRKTGGKGKERVEIYVDQE